MRPNESFLGQPIRSLQTMLRVLAEDSPEYPLVIPDGIYGPETQSAVNTFQRKHGLPATGVTNLATWEAVVAEYDQARIRKNHAHPLQIILDPGQIIRTGERHPHLSVIQGMLLVLSETYGSIPVPSVNGLLDAATSESISSFQMLSGLPMTGQLDKLTWKHLALQYPLAAILQITEKE